MESGIAVVVCSRETNQEKKEFLDMIGKTCGFNYHVFFYTNNEGVGLTKIYNDILDKSPFNISGGQMRKVAIAGILAYDPEILLLDEPTASLDLENKKMVIDILHSLSISEIPTIIVVTHDNELNSLRNWKTINLK